MVGSLVGMGRASTRVELVQLPLHAYREQPRRIPSSGTLPYSLRYCAKNWACLSRLSPVALFAVRSGPSRLVTASLRSCEMCGSNLSSGTQARKPHIGGEIL